MLTIIAICLLTLAGLGIIFSLAFYRLWLNPPAINVIFTVPDRIVLVQQKLPASIETDKPTEVPIPVEILDYINLESDTWAQEGRKRRVRAIYNDSQDWKYAFRQLQIEDGLNDE